MVKQGFFPTLGRRSFTTPAQRNSFCRRFTCCQDIPVTWTLLLQLVTGTSGGPVVLHCIKVTMTHVPDSVPRRWEGSFTAPNCIQGVDEKETVDIVFTCDDQGPANPEDCSQIFRLTIEGILTTIDECCCFDSDPELTGVGAGPFCIVGGIGTLWGGARRGDGTGCNCNTWEEADENDGSIPIAWGYALDEYGLPCEGCEPSPCPDDCCPENPCGMAMMEAAAEASDLDYQFRRDPEFEWLRKISQTMQQAASE